MWPGAFCVCVHPPTSLALAARVGFQDRHLAKMKKRRKNNSRDPLSSWLTLVEICLDPTLTDRATLRNLAVSHANCLNQMFCLRFLGIGCDAQLHYCSRSRTRN